MFKSALFIYMYSYFRSICSRNDHQYTCTDMANSTYLVESTYQMTRMRPISGTPNDWIKISCLMFIRPV